MKDVYHESSLWDSLSVARVKIDKDIPDFSQEGGYSSAMGYCFFFRDPQAWLHVSCAGHQENLPDLKDKRDQSPCQ